MTKREVVGRMTIAEAAVEVLAETGNDGVAWGDSGLLHLICERAGLPHRGWKTEGLILAGIDRRPDLFVKKYYRAYRGKLCRSYYVRKPKEGTDAQETRP